eukprot:5126951-Alexandrium_andersonii.AAC.1
MERSSLVAHSVYRCHCLPHKDARAHEHSAQQSRAAHMSHARFACTGLGMCVSVRSLPHKMCACAVYVTFFGAESAEGSRKLRPEGPPCSREQ